MTNLINRTAALLAIGCGVLAAGPATLSAQGPDKPLEKVVAAEQQRIAAIAKAKKGSVSVFAAGGRGGGSGVVITPDGYALTNYHVVKPAGTFMKCSMPDNVLYDAVIVGIDPVGDVALIKLLGRDDFPCATMVDSNDVKVGDWCFAIGNPFLLATDFQPTVTYGIVSGVHRYQYPAGTLLEYADCIQTDASINPGNSGGPLFNANGDLIGINGRGSFEKRGRVNVGVGYAISINQIKHFMGYLRSGRIVDHATLGASVSTDEEGKVRVTNILESSDAYRRGLRYNDEVVSFGGRSIGTTNAFKNVLGIYPKGWRVPLVYRREGKRQEITVRLTGVHGDDELLKKVQPRRPAAPAKPAEKPPAKPGEEKKPGDKPGDKPAPKPVQLPNARAPKAPAGLAKYYAQRSGYANYYFNKLNRDRIWKNFTSICDLTAATGDWTLDGDLEGGGQMNLTLSDKGVKGSFPNGAVSLDASKDLDTQKAPQGSGGLLAALHLWRRFVTLGPQKFGDVYYLGTAPVINREGVYDVLVATHGVAESRLLFDSESGLPVGLEAQLSSSAAGGDPCELYFSDFKLIDGKQFPHRIEVRNGNDIFTTIQLKKITFGASPKS